MNRCAMDTGRLPAGNNQPSEAEPSGQPAPAADATTVKLSCVLRTVRSWSEPWANAPLPGSYSSASPW